MLTVNLGTGTPEVVAGCLNSFVRHADMVKIANIAQIVNALSPIHPAGDRVLLHTTFYPGANILHFYYISA